MKKIDSAIVWQGISHLDSNAPIVAVLTGMTGKSNNPKTGPMAQLWILRADVSPMDAIATGADSAICGDCAFRGTNGKDRGCYVTVKNAPLAVWKKFARGGYAQLTPTAAALALHANGVALRLGAYGDPAALPLSVVRDLTAGIVSHTGYTHSWTLRPDLANYVMASADSPSDFARAHAMGFRTFRTRTIDQPIMAGEIVCPASDEAGKRTTCADCTLCDGSNGEQDQRKSIAIIAHGATAKVHAIRFIASRATL